MAIHVALAKYSESSLSNTELNTPLTRGIRIFGAINIRRGCVFIHPNQPKLKRKIFGSLERMRPFHYMSINKSSMSLVEKKVC